MVLWSRDAGRSRQPGGIVAFLGQPSLFFRAWHAQPRRGVIVRLHGIESHAGWYSQWLWMLRDMAIGYQEGGADYLYALLTDYRVMLGLTIVHGLFWSVSSA